MSSRPFLSSREGHHFCEQKKLFVKDIVNQKKTKDGRTSWIVKKNEKTIVFKNRMKKTTIKNRLYKLEIFKSFLLNELIFQQILNNYIFY